MELRDHESSSTLSSSSSFDSCSDLLSLLNTSPHQLGLNSPGNYSVFAEKARHGTVIGLLPGIFRTMADVKTQNGSVSLASDLDGKSIEGLNLEDNNSHTENHADEKFLVGVDAHLASNRAAELSASFGSDMIRKEKHAWTASNQSEDDGDLVSKPRCRPSSGLEADFDLQQLENSIKFFDLYHRSTPFPHLRRSVSSRSSSPDLSARERAASAEIIQNEQGHRWSFSSPITREDMTRVSAPHKNLNSANVAPWLNYEESRMIGKADFQSTARRKRLPGIHFDDLGERRESSDFSPDGKDATCASLHSKEKNGHFALNKDFLGEMQIKKISNVGMGRKSGDWTNLDDLDLGPDEISRHLESLVVNETYVDAIKDQESQDSNVNEHAGCYSSMDASSSVSGLTLLRTDSVLSADEIPFIINSVQVVGARQRRGGSSMWQRMVGVKNHTVYCIKVVSGKQEWEVQRRYRDFMNFFQQLKRVFSSRDGTSLPSFSEEVANDARRVLGNISPSVVEARTVCIENFLQSLLQAGPPFSTATPLFWFLRPPQGTFETTGFEEHLLVQEGSTSQKSVDVQLGTLSTSHLLSPSNIKGSPREQRENGGPFTVGKTIKLILTIHQNPSMKQILHAQHHSCAGCYRHLEYETGLIRGFAQACGWGRPRFCEYTGQLFCSSCHSNELAVVPGYVLWHWDFTPKRVSQFAKSYLDSIYDQPLLCLSTANPYLYQRVTCLLKIQETRTKISRVLSCMRCASRSRILNIMGSRRYLLENNDFFALRDLEDVSKGAFAVLPGLLTAVLKTLSLHVTKQCSVCQDSGEWCGAGILCEDPFRPIFPFDEEVNVVKCKMCNAPFHRDCFAKCPSCPSCPKNWVGLNPLNVPTRT